MIIQWFPGHMTKALRQMESSIAKVDSIVYVLDARAPLSCVNVQFEPLIARRSALYVINKADMVTPKDLKAWQQYFEREGKAVVTSNSTAGRDAGKIIAALHEVNREKIERNAQKGVQYSVKAMVIGMPNTGKSTLINSLAKDKRTVTGNRPGVTKGEQWIRLDSGVVLLDTPGTLCHSIEVEQTAYNLAYIGCIRDAILDMEGLALKFLEQMTEREPDALRARYKVEPTGKTPLELYEEIARVRGFVLKKGEIDYERTAAAVMDDFRKGRMGKIILERPNE
ncbi:MAG: ribosome biogenesis GTPase YlqF [Clostridia bacterium]|nr:ribosome biogenesis GTPase YlqF [Clostridia bacterium]